MGIKMNPSLPKGATMLKYGYSPMDRRILFQFVIVCLTYGLVKKAVRRLNRSIDATTK